jgi:hypothetical protein
MKCDTKMHFANAVKLQDDALVLCTVAVFETCAGRQAAT